MIRSGVYRLLPVLLWLGQIGCRDAKRDSERVAADTTLEIVRRDDAADVVRRYYAAIRDGLYDSAYALWDGSGKASGQTRAEFESGFRQTSQTTIAIGDSTTVEGAAGSQYATVPVTVDAVLRSGARQRFVGTYTLRRSMVDGATPEQRTWHIYSAHLRQR